MLTPDQTLEENTAEVPTWWGFCLYCETEHYPFCGYGRQPSLVACKGDPSDADITAQREWLATPEGEAWAQQAVS